MFDAQTCEMTAKSVCPTFGGTYNADFCKAGGRQIHGGHAPGPACDHALVAPGIDGKRCFSDSDCPYTNAEMKVCCSAYENYLKAACTWIDSAKLEEAVTITVPSHA